MRLVRHVVVAVTCGALLAGCGGTPAASPAPSESSAPSESPSVSPSPDPAPPDRPAEVERKNRAGAIAAVRWFLDSMDYAGSTGDVEAYRTTFSEGCNRCDAIASGIERTYANGGSIEGGTWTPRRFEFYGIQQGVAYIDATIDYEPQTLTPSPGAEPLEASGASNVAHAFQLVWSADAWRIGALDPEA